MIAAVGTRVVDTRTGRQGMTTAYSAATDIYYVRDGAGGEWLVPAPLLKRDPNPLPWATLYGDAHNVTTRGNS